MPRISPIVSLAEVDRERLERGIAAYGTPQQVALRCRMVLAAARGRPNLVGLYLNPPDQALVLCVDEKTQIQALDRTQPGLPMKKGRLGTMTHDYQRNGTTCLF